jgi:hypothetical protein
MKLMMYLRRTISYEKFFRPLCLVKWRRKNSGFGEAFLLVLYVNLILRRYFFRVDKMSKANAIFGEVQPTSHGGALSSGLAEENDDLSWGDFGEVDDSFFEDSEKAPPVSDAAAPPPDEAAKCAGDSVVSLRQSLLVAQRETVSALHRLEEAQVGGGGQQHGQNGLKCI